MNKKLVLSVLLSCLFILLLYKYSKRPIYEGNTTRQQRNQERRKNRQQRKAARKAAKNIVDKDERKAAKKDANRNTKRYTGNYGKSSANKWI